MSKRCLITLAPAKIGRIGLSASGAMAMRPVGGASHIAIAPEALNPVSLVLISTFAYHY